MRIGFLTLPLIFLSASAHAQFNPFFNSLPVPTPPVYQLVRCSDCPQAQEAGQRQTAATSVDASTLSFRSSVAARQANYARFVELGRRADPGSAADLAATLRSDPVALMGPSLAHVGLRSDNVADAYTAYWIEAWQAAHGRNEENTREQVQAVRAQAAAALLTDAQVTSAPNAKKQELADALLVQALLIGAAREDALGNPAKMRAVAKAVRTGARRFNLDLDSMILTSEGFAEAERKVGALDETSLPNKTTNGSSMLMGAALAGLGFGGLWLVRGKKVGG